MMEDTGDITAVYFKFRDGKVAETVEFNDGIVFADYDRNGYVLGVELLGPCTVAVMDKVAEHESSVAKRAMKKVLKSTGPREIVI